jgi:hypothetical protein
MLRRFRLASNRPRISDVGDPVACIVGSRGPRGDLGRDTLVAPRGHRSTTHASAGRERAGIRAASASLACLAGRSTGTGRRCGPREPRHGNLGSSSTAHGRGTRTIARATTARSDFVADAAACAGTPASGRGPAAAGPWAGRLRRDGPLCRGRAGSRHQHTSRAAPFRAGARARAGRRYAGGTSGVELIDGARSRRRTAGAFGCWVLVTGRRPRRWSGGRLATGGRRHEYPGRPPYRRCDGGLTVRTP